MIHRVRKVITGKSMIGMKELLKVDLRGLHCMTPISELLDNFTVVGQLAEMMNGISMESYPFLGTALIVPND